MTKRITMFCDGCNLGQSDERYLAPKGSWAVGSIKYCIANYGWSEVDREHYCPTCTKKRKTNARKGSRYAPIPHLPAQGTGETRGSQNG